MPESQPHPGTGRLSGMIRAARAGLLGAFLAIGATHVQAAVTYSYVGPVYAGATQFIPPCAGGSCAAFPAGQRVQGAFTLTAPLAPNTALTDVRAQLASFSLSDGLTIYASTDPQVRVMQFSASTDAAGQITQVLFRIGRWQAGAAPHAAGASWDLLNGTPAPQTIATHNAPCLTVGTSAGVADVCTAFPGGHVQMSIASSPAGTPSAVQIAPTGIAAVPTLGQWAAVALALLVGLVGLRGPLRRGRELRAC